MRDLISVIVPIYNVEPFLHMCIDSIINQTYSNLEIILVASESEDNSVEIAEHYLSKDQRIIIIHRPRLGLSDGRNSGIDIANGEYICFVDSDDYISQDYIQKLYNLCIMNGCDIAQCDYLRVAESENFVSPITNNPKIQFFSNIEMCANLYGALAVPTVVAWTKLYKKTLFNSIRYPLGKLHEDTGTTYKLLYLANKVAVTNDALYYYRIRSDSIMGAHYSIKNLVGLTYHEEQLAFFKEHNVECAIYPALLECYTGSIYHMRAMKVFESQRQEIIAELSEKKQFYFRKLWSGTFLHKINVVVSIFFYHIRRILFIKMPWVVDSYRKIYWLFVS